MARIITFDLGLTDGDRARLADLFGVGTDFHGTVDDLLARLARSATSELVDQLLERSDLGGKVDAQQRRLLGLCIGVYGRRMPSSARVARLFRITPRQAQTLIDNTSSRFASELSEARRAAAIEVLGTLVQDVPNTDTTEGRYRLRLDDPGLVAYFRRLLSEVPERTRRIDPDTTDTSVYVVYDTALVGLATVLGMDVDTLREQAAGNP